MKIKKTTVADLETLFEFQQNKIASQMAAFTPKDTNNKAAYLARLTSVIVEEKAIMYTIWHNSTIVGSVLSYDMEGEPQVSYWIGKSFWGKGIATQALELFLLEFSHRPIFARVAFDNLGSQKVLEKCKFIKIGNGQYFANARGKEIEEYIYRRVS